MNRDNSIIVFFELVKAGLWGKDVVLSSYSKINWDKIYRLAIDQTVLGLVLAGLEHADKKPPQIMLLQWIGEVQIIEQQNKEMNTFLANLINDLRKADIYTILVKGQGIAQCYERPLWRACGDIDFYLSEDNFQKAKLFFKPLVSAFDPDNEYTRHINMHYNPWIVEIHENQYCSLSLRINRVLDEIHLELFGKGRVRLWNNQDAIVALPSSDNDVLIVFSHFLNHFYRGGLGLRQICDWCRLLWTYRNSLDRRLLEKRLRKMGIVSIWKAFAALAVDYLGMPKEGMPLYESSLLWRKKAKRIIDFLLTVGNFGHNRDTSYYANDSIMLRKIVSFYRRICDASYHMTIFPYHSVRFLCGQSYYGLKAFLQGE